MTRQYMGADGVWISEVGDDEFMGAGGAQVNETQSAGGVTLAIDDATHGHTADGLALTQDHQLAVQDSTHAHAADNLALTQDHQLAVADATHGHAADNVTLSTELTLSIADALHAHAADSITLVQQHVLVVADATHGHSADNVVLETGTNLAIAEATHAHTGDNLDLTQNNVLVVADAFHGHAADNVILGGLPVDVSTEGGGPDRDEISAARFTDDKSGWRKPQWVRDQEKQRAEQLARVVDVVQAPQQTPSDSVAARSLPEQSQAAPVAADSTAPVLEASAPRLLDVERARIAAKARQQREMEEIMIVLMMAA